MNMAVVVDIRAVTGHRSHGTVCTSVLGSRFSSILVQQEMYCFVYLTHVDVNANPPF